MQPVTLSVGQDLVLPGERLRWSYFMTSGLASMVSECPGRKSIEVAMVGREGLVGSELLLGGGEDAAYRTFVQAAAEAFRIDTDILGELVDTRPTLRRILLRAAHGLMIQTSESLIACCRFTLEQRLARWILMAHDRLESSDIPLTHELLATMLGVRRPGVTVALHILEGEHAIRSNRGHILVRDRARLEDMAGEAYSGIIARPLAIAAGTAHASIAA